MRRWLPLAIVVTAAACRPDSTPAPGRAAAAAARPAPAAAPASILTPGSRAPDAVLAGARHWDRGGVAGNRMLVVTFDLHDERLRQVHDAVRDTPALKGSVGLLTLSANPGDMPAVLRAHADRMNADAEIWRFAALPASTAPAVLQQFGAVNDRGVAAIVDAEGSVAKIYAGGAWTATDIVRDLESLVLRADPAVVAAYIAAQEALARDELSAAKRELRRLSDAIGEPAVSRLAAAAAQGGDIATVRTAFKPLSEALVRLPWPRQYQPMYCPMFAGNAGATWVQKAGPVTNPYYGHAMLRCGTDLSLGAHADHSPLFGGVLFMAADQFHHVEGTYTGEGVFHLRIYDNFKKQMSARAFKALAQVGGKGPSFRLTPAADGQTLDARVGALPLPAEITVTMTLDPRGPEEQFDFVFASYSPRQ